MGVCNLTFPLKYHQFQFSPGGPKIWQGRVSWAEEGHWILWVASSRHLHVCHRVSLLAIVSMTIQENALRTLEVSYCQLPGLRQVVAGIESPLLRCLRTFPISAALCCAAGLNTSLATGGPNGSREGHPRRACCCHWLWLGGHGSTSRTSDMVLGGARIAIWGKLRVNIQIDLQQPGQLGTPGGILMAAARAGCSYEP